VYDFANILFAGPCNRRCPWCIGQLMPPQVNVDNLDQFPPLGLDAFIDAVNQHRVNDIVFTGTVSDPQLYRHQDRLLALLRERLHPGARFSVHTNGALTLRQQETFNSYDRACLSLPTLEPDIYEKLMGSRRVPDLAAILQIARIPVKISAVVNEHNAHDISSFVRRCRDLGVRRLVVRRLYKDPHRWPILEDLPVVRWFKGNPVLDLDGMEITRWDFDQTAGMRSLNLFADGTLGSDYLLTETRELRAQRSLPIAGVRVDRTQA
jgi:MoaA/NifB/PqqE/SkfB family radical SAM enzyme